MLKCPEMAERRAPRDLITDLEKDKIMASNKEKSVRVFADKDVKKIYVTPGFFFLINTIHKTGWNTKIMASNKEKFVRLFADKDVEKIYYK